MTNTMTASIETGHPVCSTASMKVPRHTRHNMHFLLMRAHDQWSVGQYAPLIVWSSLVSSCFRETSPCHGSTLSDLIRRLAGGDDKYQHGLLLLAAYSSGYMLRRHRPLHRVSSSFCLELAANVQVIAKNMRSGGAIEPMIPGERVHAIFGFCDIRNFTDTTEVLQVRSQTSYFVMILMLMIQVAADTG